MKFKPMIIFLSIFFISGPLHAADKEKGASDTAYEHASDQAIFHRVGDWFSTIGKNKEEKKIALEERQQARTAKKAEKIKKNTKAKVEKNKKEMEKNVMAKKV